MPIALYMDVHVPRAISDQLQRRGVDVLTAYDDGCDELPDDALLERASSQNRVMFTQDIRFHVLAYEWQRQDRPFAGLIFGHQLAGTIGQFVNTLEFIAKASEPGDWASVVERIDF